MIMDTNDVDGCCFMKIGKSINPKKRAEQLDKGPYKVVLLWVIPTNEMSALEKRFHGLFDECLARKEWFMINDDALAFIAHYPGLVDA